MATKDDGGPAFPFTPNEQMKLPDGTWDQNTEFGDPGMSLRDWFAGQCVAELLRRPAVDNDDKLPIVARAAYMVADAMVAEKRRREAEGVNADG